MLEQEPQLIASACDGDRGAYSALYDHYIAQIYRFVYLKTGSKAEAEDLTHDVFLSAWQNIGTYRHRGHPFSSWLYQIARNKVIDHYRTRKFTSPIDETTEGIADLAMQTEHAADQTMELDRVQLAMRELSDDHQNILILRFVDDLTPGEIAEALGKTEGAVRLIQHRAIKNLRAILSDNEPQTNEDTLI
ncbi:MAG: RNA polymerase sigma factor [bacterium]|nr:RNA polymerase sigma factor [bacterium]